MVSFKISCSATTSVDREVEKKKTLDAEETALLVKDLQNVFRTGRTKSYEWRISQLNSIAKMLQEKENDITEALYKDLSKPQLEAFVSEVYFLKQYIFFKWV